MTIRLLLLAAFVLGILTAVAATATPAAAAEYPWCAVYRVGGGTNCGYTSFQQCRATVSGNGGFCEPNPFYQGSQQPAARKRKRPPR
jgi:hypothetical protein